MEVNKIEENFHKREKVLDLMERFLESRLRIAEISTRNLGKPAFPKLHKFFNNLFKKLFNK
jgi:hypothetical protein